ncbi:12544_t:CDS:1, partial [Funneliformis caledonium]
RNKIEILEEDSMDVPFEDTMEETGIEIDNYLDIEESKEALPLKL